jgi:hypothetical protein
LLSSEGKDDDITKFTSRAGFHHRSTNITLLHAVKLRPVHTISIGNKQLNPTNVIPVPPALKEMRITLVDLLSLIVVKAFSLSSFLILPSSIADRVSFYHRKGIFDASHRTYLKPSAFKNGCIKFNMLVNCENIMVFSPSPLASTSHNSFNIIRTLAESGGRSDTELFIALA